MSIELFSESFSCILFLAFESFATYFLVFFVHFPETKILGTILFISHTPLWIQHLEFAKFEIFHFRFGFCDVKNPREQVFKKSQSLVRV